jgi:hypothetical protein
MPCVPPTKRLGDRVAATKPRLFWEWFLFGNAAGWKRFRDRWAFLHLVVGLVLAVSVPLPLNEAAKAVLLPLAGVLVGMSFAWVGNALAIAQSTEIDRLADHHPEGYESYVHPYQAAILIILASLVGWGLAGLGVFDEPCPLGCSTDLQYYLCATLLYGLASMAMRECWHVVMGAQLLLLFQRGVRRLPVAKNGEPEDSSTAASGE